MDKTLFVKCYKMNAKEYIDWLIKDDNHFGSLFDTEYGIKAKSSILDALTQLSNNEKFESDRRISPEEYNGPTITDLRDNLKKFEHSNSFGFILIGLDVLNGSDLLKSDCWYHLDEKEIPGIIVDYSVWQAKRNGFGDWNGDVIDLSIRVNTLLNRINKTKLVRSILEENKEPEGIELLRRINRI